MKAEINDGKPAKWKPEKHLAFIDLCGEEIEQRNRVGDGIK